jgi:hypothetical protein
MSTGGSAIGGTGDRHQPVNLVVWSIAGEPIEVVSVVIEEGSVQWSTYLTVASSESAV